VTATRRADAPPAQDGLKFLGTAGARHVVATQLRHSGGLVYTLSGFRLWVDPGPGALVRALASRPRLDPSKVDALLLTHRHLDHAGDATAVVEAMTGGGSRARATLLAPTDALDGEAVVFRYAQGFVARVERLRQGGRWELSDDVVLETPLAHDHGVETYGYVLRAPGVSVGHVVDTFWMDALPAAYRGVEVLLVNTTRLQGGDRHLLHLGADDAARLIGAVRPRLAVLTHFGMQIVRRGPDEVALAISDATGVPTIAARDGQTLPLPPPLELPRPRPRPRGGTAREPA
jgi:phosphoribosyl 1,2-cyclic phosphodiesterase